jgi:hypothetical protein
LRAFSGKRLMGLILGLKGMAASAGPFRASQTKTVQDNSFLETRIEA